MLHELVSDRFPAATTVGAYVASREWPGAGTPPTSQGPKSTPVATAVVDAHGKATFAGLDPDTGYWAVGDVLGEHRWVRFRSDPSKTARYEVDDPQDLPFVITVPNDQAEDTFRIERKDGTVLLEFDKDGKLHSGIAFELPYLDVRDYGAQGDGQRVNDASITNGQKTLTSAQANFTQADVGKLVVVESASAVTYEPLITTIASVAGGVATLVDAAGATVAGGVAVFGTDDTAALQSAINTASVRYSVTGQRQILALAGLLYVTKWQNVITDSWNANFGVLMKAGVVLTGPGEVYVGHLGGGVGIGPDSSGYKFGILATKNNDDWAIKDVTVSSSEPHVGDSIEGEYHFGIGVLGCDDWEIDDCRITGIAGDGIVIGMDPGEREKPRRWKIRRNRLRYILGQALSVLDCADGQIQGNFAADCTQIGGAECYSFQQLDRVAIDGNYSDNWGTTALINCVDCTHNDNVIIAPAGAQQGLALNNCQNTVAIGNTIDCSLRGTIAFPPNGIILAGRTNGVAIIGNTIKLKAGSTAVGIAHNGGAIYRGLLIEGNTLDTEYDFAYAVTNMPSVFARYTFDERAGGTGGQAADSIGTHHGTYQGGVNLDGIAGLTADNLTLGASFDGANDFVQLPNDPAFADTTISVSMWVKTSEARVGRVLICKQLAWQVGIDSGVLKLFDYASASYKDTTKVINDNLRHHVGATIQLGVTNGTKVYLDGQLVLTTTIDATDNTVAATIMAETGAGATAGVADEVAFFSNILTAAQMRQLYEAGIGLAGGANDNGNGDIRFVGEGSEIIVANNTVRVSRKSSIVLGSQIDDSTVEGNRCYAQIATGGKRIDIKRNAAGVYRNTDWSPNFSGIVVNGDDCAIENNRLETDAIIAHGLIRITGFGCHTKANRIKVPDGGIHIDDDNGSTLSDDILIGAPPTVSGAATTRITRSSYRRSAAPTSGRWERGDIVFNTNATVGQPHGWMCTVAGTPGTWVALANL